MSITKSRSSAKAYGATLFGAFLVVGVTACGGSSSSSVADSENVSAPGAGNTLSTANDGYVGCDCGSVDQNKPCTSDDLSINYEFRGESRVVSFQFGDVVACGQFTSGRYWVAPMVENAVLTLISTYPLTSGIGETTENGLMNNVNTMNISGFPFTGSGRFFSDTYALETPHVFETSTFVKNARNIGSHTIFKSVSHPQNTTIDTASDPARKCSNKYRNCEEGIFSLALLSSPPGDVFAPPFFGDSRPMLDAALFNENLLPNLAPVASMATFEDAFRTLRFSRVANLNRNLNARESHYGEVNVNSDRGYPGFWLQKQWEAVLRTATKPDNPSEALLRLKSAKAITQQAIDLYAIFAEGGDKGSPNDLCGAWIANGGFGQGRLGMTVIGLSLIEKKDWLSNINNIMSSFLGRQCFGESMIIQAPDSAGRDEPLFGTLSSEAYYVSPTNKTAGDPEGWRDGSGNAVSGCGSQYQPIVTGGMVGEAMAVLSFPAAYAGWPENFSHFFDYIERSFATGNTSSAYAYCTANSSALQRYTLSFVPDSAIEMWDSYYNCARAGNCDGF